MGCLNDDWGREHKFGNIHLSGPCNRTCYFCIGQHMPGVRGLNTLGTWPLPGLDKFLQQAAELELSQVFLTGSDTEPALYEHHEELIWSTKLALGKVSVGIRTNGTRPHVLSAYDEGSLSITSFDPELYRATMGGEVPDVVDCLRRMSHLMLYMCLTPHTTISIHQDIVTACDLGFQKINLRELYGQPNVGNPLHNHPSYKYTGEFLGNPQYRHIAFDSIITYWDVHYTECTSLNLYANGRVSRTYSVTAGHDPSVGEVKPQLEFTV